MAPSSTLIFETKWGNMANAISRDSLISHEWFKLCIGGYIYIYFALVFFLLVFQFITLSHTLLGNMFMIFSQTN